MKRPDLYFSDPEVGLAPETSHPEFLQVASEEFYFDYCDDFSPFGSDDGSDTLDSLENWFREGGRSFGVIHFLQSMIDLWGCLFRRTWIERQTKA